MPRQKVEITDDNGRHVATVLYDAEARCLRLLEIVGGAKVVRVWSPTKKDFRVAPMLEDEKVVDVKWL